MAHALAGPLIAARSSLDRAAASHPGDPDVAQAVAAVARATTMLDALARLTAATRRPYTGVASLDGALRTALRRTAHVVPPPEVQAAALPDVDADEDQLAALLTELLTNAALHAGPGVRVTVRAETETETEADGDVVRLTVQDDGPGLPAGIDADDPLPFRAGGGDGAGCGLAVVAAVAHGHGGTLTLTSGPAPVGLCAQVTLPAAGPAA